MTTDIVFRLKRSPSWDWTLKNVVLEPGEPGFETDTKKFKVGDGGTRWNDLGYAMGGASGGDDTAALAALQAHIDSQTPHPAYDDGPSLFLLYQNAKV